MLGQESRPLDHFRRLNVEQQRVLCPSVGAANPRCLIQNCEVSNCEQTAQATSRIIQNEYTEGSRLGKPRVFCLHVRFVSNRALYKRGLWRLGVSLPELAVAWEGFLQ